MQRNLKTIAAAVALAFASAGAHAAIQGATAAGGSELVFFAFDATDPFATPSFVMDLGVTFDAFAASKTYGSFGSNNVSSTAQWGQYKAAVGNDLSSTVWGVFAAKAAANPNSAGGFRTLTTSANVPPSMTGTSSSNFTAVNVIFGNFLTLTADVSGIAVNNAYFTPGSTTDQSNWGQAMGDRMGGKLGSQFGGTVNAINVDANMYLLSRGASGPAAPTRADVLTLAADGYRWQFDGNTVVAAPIPEPETYALMAVGLALVGGIARRRRSRA